MLGLMSTVERRLDEHSNLPDMRRGGAERKCATALCASKSCVGVRTANDIDEELVSSRFQRIEAISCLCSRFREWSWAVLNRDRSAAAFEVAVPAEPEEA